MSETRNDAEVPRNEGNEVKREGRTGVGTAHSTDESGEPDPRDSVEGRRRRYMEPMEGKMKETLNSGSISTRLYRIAELAREHPERAFKTLAHVTDLEFLKEAYRRTRKDGAVGVDGITAQEYESNLVDNLKALLNRFKDGSYRAPPVRRVYIPKGGNSGKLRPIGIPTFEDKVLQRAVAMVLEAIYEQDFLPCSYGFRPKRSAHQALKQLRDAMMSIHGGWVLEVDIEGYFDNVNRGHLRDFLDRRVLDGVIRRTINKWLKAGVMDKGLLSYPKSGTPQGGVASPILSNIYLHEVMDVWYEREVKPRLGGSSCMVRYADDILAVFEKEEDARRVMSVIPKRFGKYGLKLHPEKTRLLRFERPPKWPLNGNGSQPKPQTFDFLGFTHYWARSKKDNWVVKVKTSKSRFSRALHAINDWCAKFRHKPVREQWSTLSKKLNGHYAYYGVTGNSHSINRFWYEVGRIWRYWLNKRSSNNPMPYSRFIRLLKTYQLPTARIVHHDKYPTAKPCH